MVVPLILSKGLVKLKKFKPKKKTNRSLDKIKLKKWSILIRSRDKKCVSCNSKKNLHAHHIISKYYRPHLAYNLSNGITLCKSCHIGPGGVHDKRNPPKNAKIAHYRKIFLINRPPSRKKRKRFKKY